MKTEILLLRCVMVLAVLSVARSPASDVILHNFVGGADGSGPGALTLSGSVIYGATASGGNGNRGTLYSFDTNGGGYTVLKTFTGGDGAYPYGKLVVSNSVIYGMTENGGTSNYGTIYSIKTDGTGQSTLHTFAGGTADGKDPFGSLILSGSTLFGMTNQGGNGGSNGGTIFQVNTDGSGYAIVHNFASGASDGAYPMGALTLSNSTLYGMTSGGGSGSDGTIFSLSTGGSGFHLLHTFTGTTSDGKDPYDTLTLVGAKLYGTTYSGGASNEGTIFSINTDGSGFSLLYSFSNGLDGGNPESSLTPVGSSLVGTTYYGGNSANGVVFGINTDGTDFSVIQRFGGFPDGAQPTSDLIVSADGQTLFGSTAGGGTGHDGILFSLAVSLPEPSTAPLITLGFGLMALGRPGKGRRFACGKNSGRV